MAQTGTLGAVIFDARIGTLAETAGHLARVGTRSATSVGIGTSRLRPVILLEPSGCVILFGG
jgi:hypothetical protein